MTTVALELPRTSVAVADVRTAEGFKAVALEHRHGLYRVAVRLLADEHGAEDVVQEALVRAFAARERFRGDARAFTWLCGFVVNLCRAELRRRRVRGWLSWVVQPGTDSPEPSAPLEPDELERAEREAALRAALARLPEGQRAALVLVAQEGLTAGEAATLLGSTEAAVWQAASRARKALRDALGGGA